MAPRKAYLELEAQPDKITPYTPKEVSANMYSRPAFMLARITPLLNGITAQAAKAVPMDRTGARKKMNLLALAGTTTSLNTSLNTSAKGWNRPQGPTRF